MKTFKEFTLCLERYYRPDEPLPSGKTPLGKHINKRMRFDTTGQTDKEERLSRNFPKVRRGADNPEFDLTPHDDLKITKPFRDENYTVIKHKPSGVTFHIDSGNRHHNVAWSHGKEKDEVKHRDRMAVIKHAKNVWRQHIEPRFAYKDTLENMPTPNEKDESRNTRARVYQKFGFGETDRLGYQMARVGRPPSPRQAAKGKTRLKPIEPQGSLKVNRG